MRIKVDEQDCFCLRCRDSQEPADDLEIEPVEVADGTDMKSPRLRPPANRLAKVDDLATFRRKYME
jgi:metal-dependent HD superfamily phosphatase/phosphodiesterase